MGVSRGIRRGGFVGIGYLSVARLVGGRMAGPRATSFPRQDNLPSTAKGRGPSNHPVLDGVMASS